MKRLSTKPAKMPDLVALSPAELRARIEALQTELARRQSAGAAADRIAGDPDALTTVKVPPPFEAPFLRAQQYVAQYFAERIEQPESATIAIAGERYVLLRAASLSVEFIELVMSLYQDKGPVKARGVANNLLFDLAHAIGKADARSFQAKMGVSDPIENLSAGPIHFAFAGWAFVDISSESVPSPDENYFLLYDHPFSFESHSWLAKGKQSEQPVCIMNAGYSSGWCAESFGVPLVAVEIECQAAGGKHCRFIMAPPSRIEEHLQRYKQQHGMPPGTDLHERVREIPEFFQRKRYEEELRTANEQLEQRVRERTHELKHQALHDALTGLPNRVLLHDRIEQSIRMMHRNDIPFALLFLDLDGFKEINDTFGHYTGDILLARVSSRLQAQLRETDTIARLGGDEFGVLLTGLETPETAERLARQLIKALDQPVLIEDHKLTVGASVGIAHCPVHGSDATTLMRCADVAMYAAKAANVGVKEYSADQDIHSPARIRLVSELRTSIDDRHLVLYYQPQIDTRSGEPVAVEALLRWNHADGRRLLPDEFLPLAENSDLIDRITHWVLNAALRDCRSCRDMGISPAMSVNIAPRSLRTETFPDLVKNLIAEYGMPPENLTLEITESSVLVDTEKVISTLKQLRDIGVGISIDDFGTGYSSLTHLRRLPVTEIKIDRSFLRELLTNKHDIAIVRSAIELGHALNCTVVAEGVESRAVLERLREYGCERAQGYYISPAQEKTALRDWLVATPSFFADEKD